MRCLPSDHQISKSSEGLEEHLITIFGSTNISFKCCGQRPSGPPADPMGNDLTALMISGLVTGSMVLVSSEAKRGGMDESG